MLNKAACSCAGGDAESTYADGPTACVAHPKVMTNIKKQIARAKILSVADARIAAMAGMLDAPTEYRIGFNDGVIYPPDSGTGASPTALRRRKLSRVSRAHALAVTSAPQTLNCLVFLVEFSDNKGTQTAAHYQKLLFDLSNPNSMASFYRDLSYGKLIVTGQVIDWIKAKKPYGHYTDGASGTGTYPKNTPALLEEVLTTWTTGGGKFTPFDVNADGFLDGLFLIHAGKGAEAEPSPTKRKDMIWSHKWTLQTPIKKNNVTAYAYFTAPEDGKLGVFSHEFGHFLGLPDLYDTTYRSHGIGDWCLMAGGSWGGNGNTPARMSAWCLERLGWIKPAKVTASGTLTLKTLEQDKTACNRIEAGSVAPNEYFLLENRQKSGRDSSLPGHGLAVWHIDNTQSTNSNPLAYKVALVQADGRRDLELLKNSGDPSDLFPGSLGVTSVSGSSSTHPHLRANNGAATSISLKSISDTSGVVKVKA